MVRLGDYVNIKTGKLDANAASENGKYPFFTCAIEPLRIDEYRYDCECVLVAGNGDLNVKYYNGKFNAYQRTYIIESKDKTILDVKYLYIFLSQYVETLREQSIGGVIKYIKLENLTNAKLNILSIVEQNSIVQNIEKLDFVITRRKQQLQKLDELVKARFVEMFGDEFNSFLKLGDLASVTGGLTKNAKRKDMLLKLPYLRVANVYFNHIDTREMLEIGLTEEEHKKTLLKHGDLLFVEGNGSPEQIGRVAMWRDEVNNCVHQNHLIKVRLDVNNMNPVFVMHYFMTLQGREQIKKKAVSTSGLHTLSVSKISDLEVPIVPIYLQNLFVDFVEQIDKSKLEVQKSLDKLETLKKALMQKYFG